MLCYICGQIAGDPSADLLARHMGGVYRRRIITESSSFVLMPSLGAVSVGHVLICPVRHLRRLADVEQCDMGEYRQFVDEARELLRTEFGGVVHSFEHGGDANGVTVPCTVDHAHLHLVPLATSVVIDLPARHSWLKVEPAALSEMVGASEYLYYEAPDGIASVAVGSGQSFESQLLRRVFCASLGEIEWNWRESPKLGLVSETVARLAKTPRRGMTRSRRDEPLTAKMVAASDGQEG